MNANLHLWIIPILPLVGAAINGLPGRRFSQRTVAAVALGFCGAASAWALWVALHFSSLTLPYTAYVAHWMRAGNFEANFAFYLDQLPKYGWTLDTKHMILRVRAASWPALAIGRKARQSAPARARAQQLVSAASSGRWYAAVS